MQEASGVVDIKSWPITLDTDDMPKKKLSSLYRAPTAEMLAYLDFRLVSSSGRRISVFEEGNFEMIGLIFFFAVYPLLVCWLVSKCRMRL